MVTKIDTAEKEFFALLTLSPEYLNYEIVDACLGRLKTEIQKFSTPAPPQD